MLPSLSKHSGVFSTKLLQFISLLIVIETLGQFTILRYHSDRELLCQDYILIMKYKQGSFVYNKGMIFLNCDLQFFKKKPSGSRNEDGKIQFIFIY